MKYKIIIPSEEPKQLSREEIYIKKEFPKNKPTKKGFYITDYNGDFENSEVKWFGEEGNDGWCFINSSGGIIDKKITWFMERVEHNEKQTDTLELKQIIIKEEPRYPIGGYAPGNYTCRCATCNKIFQGDKRAVQCECCAVEMVNIQLKINDKSDVETKQETIEEIVNNFKKTDVYINEIKQSQEKMYSEEEVFNICREFAVFVQQKRPSYKKQLEWFEQFKNK